MTAHHYECSFQINTAGQKVTYVMNAESTQNDKV